MYRVSSQFIQMLFSLGKFGEPQQFIFEPDSTGILSLFFNFFSEDLQGLHSFVSMDFLSPTFDFQFKGRGHLFKPFNLLTASTIFFAKMFQSIQSFCSGTEVKGNMNKRLMLKRHQDGSTYFLNKAFSKKWSVEH